MTGALTPRARALIEIALLAAALFLVCAPLFARASLEVDDCRYFWQLRQIDAGVPGAFWSSLVVENRWDQDWWVPDGTFVRFLRPWVIASYALDRALFGIDPTASVVVNLLLHLIVVVQFRALLVRLIGPGLPAFLGALLFTTMSCHAEHLWYIAGRTDTIGGIFFLWTLLWHLRTRERATVRTHAVTAVLWFASLLAKELTVWLPLLLLLLDRWLPPAGAGQPALRQQLRRDVALWIACAVAFVVWLGVRSLLLGEGGSGSRPAPYFHLPWYDGFWLRTAAVAAQYCVALVTGDSVVPFLRDGASWFGAPERSWFELGLSLLAVPGLLLWGWRQPVGRFAVVLFLLLLIPMLPVYSSNRYLYLPSMAWCLLIALACARLRRISPWLMLLLAAAVILPTAIRLNLMLHNTPYQDSRRNPAPSWHLAKWFRDSDLTLAPGRPVYIVDFPLKWLELQFLRQTLAILLDREMPPVRGLCLSDSLQLAPVRVERVDDYTIELHRGGAPIYQPIPGWDFEPRPLAIGDRVREQDYEVLVLAAQQGAATRIRVRFDRPLAELELGRFSLYRDGPRLRRL